MANQHDMRDPLTQYIKPPFEKQPQDPPGLATAMHPRPDHGEGSYVGSGRLKGRKALVTGSDSGIGRAVAIAYAREGADVVLNYLPVEEEDAREVVALIEQAGRKAVAIPGDLTDESFCSELVRRAHQELDGLDILANIAGRMQYVMDIADLTTEHFEATLRVNVLATFWLCKAAIPLMPKGAAIINTTSIQGYQPSPQVLDYATSKGAITSFTHGLAKQVASKGIRVNAVAPGPVWTPLQVAHGQPQDMIPELGASVPLERAGQPAELAPAYVYLASQESSYVTAEIMGVTGGNHLP